MLTEYRDSERSPLRKLDPRTLLVAATGAAFCFSCVRNLAPSCLCLAFALLLAAVRRPPVLPLLKRLLAVNAFTLFLWLTVPLAMPGESVARLGPLSWSGEGVSLALLATIKCNAVFLSFLALVAGTDPARIGCALERLRAPAKLAFLFLFTCRYIHVVGEEWRRLRTAAKLRGFVPRNSLHTYKTIGSMLGLAFINAIDRSRRVYEAMLLRGFGGTFHTVTELRGSPADGVFAALFFCALGGILLLDLCMK
ncbi:MAG: cobalt ECF transporter T component CbiQ [Planctomycetota bacterium]|jgi:cobalt/nickel transport system permease protein|nr:cobalt ECF transporter T component CbiQ [Planctomycetota bacterium]